MTGQADVRAGDEIDEKSLRQQLQEFQRSALGRSIWQMVNTLVPFAGLWWLAYQVMQYSYWLTLPILLVAVGFSVRIFIIFHDCGHSSFFKSQKANDIVGMITGVLTFTPYYYWRKTHQLHHASSGNLDKRGQGDIWMMTVEEYRRASRFTRLFYRLYRNPLVMFVFGPIYLTLVVDRFVMRKASRREHLSVWGTNVAIVLVALGMSQWIGFKAYLQIQLPILFIAQAIGIGLFYVQHQFEGVYWSRQDDWNVVDGSIRGSSFYALPAILHWFTGNIGYHHVHHVSPKIPNYLLARCHRQVPAMKMARRVGLAESFRSLTFRLYDEVGQRLVGFRQAKLLDLEGRRQ